MIKKSLYQNKFSDKLLLWSFCAMFFFVPVATSPAIISGLLALSIWIFSGKFMRDSHTWRDQEWFKPVVLLMLLPWIGLLWTEDITTGLAFARKSYYWLYSFAILSLCHVYSPKILINSFLAGLSFTVFVSITQYVGFIPMPKGYPAGFMGHISYSLLLVFGILLLSFYYRETHLKKHRVAELILIVVYVFSLSVNTGRIGYLSFVILSPWLLYNLLGKKHIVIFVTSVCALTVILSLSPTVQKRTGEAWDELKAYYHGDKNTSVGRRPYMWDSAMNMFLNNPVIGIGTGAFNSEIGKYKDDPNLPDFISHPHNSFLYMAVSFGIIGLIIMIWLLVVFFRKGWQAKSSFLGSAILSFGAIMLFGSFTDTQILTVSTGSMFALLMGTQDENKT